MDVAVGQENEPEGREDWISVVALAEVDDFPVLFMNIVDGPKIYGIVEPLVDIQPLDGNDRIEVVRAQVLCSD